MARSPVTAPGAAAVGPYSHGVRAGNVVYLSGQTPSLGSTGQLAEGGIEAQVRQCFRNLGAVLEAAGLGFADVLKCNVFLVDMADFATMNRIYAEHFQEPEVYSGRFEGGWRFDGSGVSVQHQRRQRSTIDLPELQEIRAAAEALQR